jgi:hypothetical protein
MTRQFGTVAVLGVVTGTVLEEGGFPNIHEVLDHLYPGIMTIDCGLMSKTASNEIVRQHPATGKYRGDVTGKWREMAQTGLEEFGPTIGVEGPMVLWWMRRRVGRI